MTLAVVHDPRPAAPVNFEGPSAGTRDPGATQPAHHQGSGRRAGRRWAAPRVGKADDLAGIGRSERASLRRRFETEFGAEYERDYDSVRWNEE